MNQKSHFETYDLNLTATMIALGHSLDSLKKEPNGRSKFYFQHTEELKADVLAFWQQSLRINPHTIFDSLKFLKSRIYSENVY